MTVQICLFGDTAFKPVTQQLIVAAHNFLQTTYNSCGL